MFLSKLINRNIFCIFDVGFLFLSSVMVGLEQSPSLAQCTIFSFLLQGDVEVLLRLSYLSDL